MTEYYKQPFNNTVPELVKVSNWEDDESKNEILVNVQEIAATAEAIAGNGEATNNKIDTLNGKVDNLATENTLSSVKTSSSNTATATSSLYSSVGTPADGSSENTVIGLLKSIANKL